MRKSKKETDPAVCGVLPVAKPVGPTSHDVVDLVRRALNTRQVGHTGTLDPAASGLLMLCTGPYTKLVPFLIDADKTYRGVIGLGLETDTDDKEGLPTLGTGAAGITMERVKAAAARFVGEIEQVPPAYSAVKVSGKKLYEYARENEKIEVEARQVTVHSFEIVSLAEQPVPALVAERAAEGGFTLPASIMAAEFEARVSSGTYLRAIARDLGRELGAGGFLAGLERTAVGQVSLEAAIGAEELAVHPERGLEHLMKGPAALDKSRYPVVVLLKGYERRLATGQPLNEKMMDNPNTAGAVPSGALCAIASEEGALLAIASAERFEAMRRANPYDSRFDVHFKPVRVFPGGLR